MPSPSPLTYRNLQLLHGLEEFKSGAHAKMDFSAALHQDYYKSVLKNLHEMEEEDESLQILDTIRERIYEDGW